jgi:hypothetical protein
MTKDKAYKEIIRCLISKQEFKRAENILLLIQVESDRLETLRLILKELLKTRLYKDAFVLIHKYLSGNELAFHILEILKNMQLCVGHISVEQLTYVDCILSEIEDDRCTIKTHALIAEVLCDNNQLDLAEKHIFIALNIWDKASGELSDLSPIIKSLKAQRLEIKATELLDSLSHTISNNVFDRIALANCIFELGQLRSLLNYEADYESEENSRLLEGEVYENSYDLNEVRAACFRFLEKPRIIEIDSKEYQVLCGLPKTLKDHLDYYKSLDVKERNQELISLREQLILPTFPTDCCNRYSSSSIIEQLAKYCALSHFYYEHQQWDLSDNILSHALSIALSQDDVCDESKLIFAAGPKYECLYILCYHNLIQGDVLKANGILETMEGTYNSINGGYNFYKLCGDALTWISYCDNHRTRILEFLFKKLYQLLSESISIENIRLTVRILCASVTHSERQQTILRFRYLLEKVSNSAIDSVIKEACVIELLKGALEIDYLEIVLESMRSGDFSEKGLEVIHEEIAHYYLSRDPNLVKLTLRMKEHGRWLPHMNLRNIMDDAIIASLNAESVARVIYLFSERPDNLEFLLQEYTLN